MPKIDASKYGYISSGNETTFNSARTNGVTVINQPTSSNTLVSQFFRDSGKGGTVYKIARFLQEHAIDCRLNIKGNMYS